MADRVYTIPFVRQAVSGPQDLVAVYSGSKAFKLLEVTIGQITTVTPQNLSIVIKRLLATVTQGSGGNAVTPQPTNPGDVAATVTARANDTSGATSSGGANILEADAYDPVNGWIYRPPEDQRHVFAPSQACVIALDQLGAPSSSETTSGTVKIAELF